MLFIMRKYKYPEINIYFKDRQNYLKSVNEFHCGNYKLIIDFLIRTMESNYKFLKNE